MNICSRKMFLGLSALVFSIASTPAPADVLLNTINGLPFLRTTGEDVEDVEDASPINTSVALSFSSPVSTTISEIDAFIGLIPPLSTNQTITLGIMSDGGGRPSGHFLDSSLVTLSLSSPVTLTSLNWAINGGTTYWLAAVASDGTVGAWNDNGAMDRWAVTNNQGNWGVVAGSSAPEAEIFSVAAVPEAPTYAMMILGFAGIGLLAYRRKSVRLRLT
jgi:hypothetical protein